MVRTLLARYHDRTVFFFPPQSSMLDPMENLLLLEQERARLSQSTRAANTISGYTHGWKMFSTWCAETGYVALPATDHTIALYLTHMITSGNKVASAEHRLAAIRYQHRENEIPAPDGPLVRAVVWGAKRALKQQPTQKCALTTQALKLICATVPVVDYDIRNRAILLFGFATALRRCEIARMNFEDVTINARGMLVHLRFEKQDQTGRGREIAVCPAHTPELCAIEAMRAWFSVRGDARGPLFYRFRNGRMLRIGFTGRGERVAWAVKHEVERVGLDPARYGGHSLRAGFITAAALAGATDSQIMRHTGHRDVNVLRKYIRGEDPFEGAVSGMLRL